MRQSKGLTSFETLTSVVYLPTSKIIGPDLKSPSSDLQILLGKGVTNTDLLVNQYQRLLQVCLTILSSELKLTCEFTQAENQQRLKYNLGQASKSLETSYSCQRS